MLAQDKLIYVGDPMCSWCYGFAPELEELVDRYKDQMEIELVTGGLRPYFEKPIHEMKDFLTRHWQDVHKTSLQAFNYDILDRTDIDYDTEPACRAVVVVRHIGPGKEFEFFKMIQRAFYFQNIDLSIVENYYAILDDLDLDKDMFVERFNSDIYKELVKNDFKRAIDLGVHGFPSLLLRSGDELIIISRGYTPAAKVIQTIDHVLQRE